MAKLLLTGATGYIGSGLVPMLEAAGHEVACLVRNCDVSYSGAARRIVIPQDLEALTEILKAEQPDAVVHLASLFLASHFPAQAGELIESNVAFPTRLLEAMKGSGIRLFLNAGTIFQSADGRVGSPLNLYAASKQAFEEILHHYARNESFHVLTLRLADTYGVGDTRRKLVQLLVDSAIRGESLGMSPGEQKLSLTWVDDVRVGFVRGVEHLLFTVNPGHEVFGLCNPNLVSVRELGALVQEVAARPVQYRWGERPYRPGEIMEPVLPLPLHGWMPKVDLRQGLGRLWLANQRNQKGYG